MGLFGKSVTEEVQDQLFTDKQKKRVNKMKKKKKTTKAAQGTTGGRAAQLAKQMKDAGI